MFICLQVGQAVKTGEWITLGGQAFCLHVRKSRLIFHAFLTYYLLQSFYFNGLIVDKGDMHDFICSFIPAFK